MQGAYQVSLAPFDFFFYIYSKTIQSKSLSSSNSKKYRAKIIKWLVIDLYVSNTYLRPYKPLISKNIFFYIIFANITIRLS